MDQYYSKTVSDKILEQLDKQISYILEKARKAVEGPRQEFPSHSKKTKTKS